MNIREKQRNAIIRMFRYKDGDASEYLQDINTNAKFSQNWKLLIYDQACRDIVSQLFTVQDLREHGITLYMLLEGKSKRDVIPDVPALYFIYPTEDNMRRLKQDFQQQLYDSVFVNFASPTPRHILEVLATNAVETEAVSTISKVYDQNVGFVSLESDLASLNMKNSFVAYNRPTDRNAVEAVMNEIADGICSLVSTLGTIPIIRAPKGGPAEMVARFTTSKLCTMVRDSDSVFNSLNIGTSSAALQRPVLLILDRGVDIATVLKYNEIYQTNVDDILEMNMNNVVLPDSKKTIHLDSDVDEFWKNNSGKSITQVDEARQQWLAKLTTAENKIKQDGPGATPTGEDLGFANMKDSVQSLPAIIKAKERLGTHVDLLLKIHSAWTSSKREISVFLNDTIDVMSVIKNPDYGVVEKFRLVAVHMLTKSPSSQEVTDISNAFTPLLNPEVGTEEMEATIDREELGDIQKSFNYIRKFLNLSRATQTTNTGTASAANAASASFWDFTNKGINRLNQKMAQMVGGSSLLSATRMMNDICSKETSQKSSEMDAEYLYFDPKVNEQEVATHARIRTEFSQGILFMVGGGCYTEYHNVREHAAANNRNIIYGCTELLRAKTFIQQLSVCGS